MPDLGNDLRPDVETFEHLGCRVTLVNAAEILAVAREERVELLRGAAFPAPVRRVRFSVECGLHDGQPAYLLDAEIDAVPGQQERLGSAVAGISGPVGVLLAKRIAAGDPLAARIADGLGAAADEAYRRLGLGRPAPPRTVEVSSATRQDEAVGLTAEVTHRELATAIGGGRTVTVRAAAAREAMSTAHLRAMFCFVLDAVAELAGAADALAGRRYMVSRYVGEPAGSRDESESVTLDQVGGLRGVVAQFRQVAVSFRHPDVMARWGARRPQGILLYGPPGTGKTMLARALANEIGANFREIRTPEILDKWLGASERNIKRIFRDARRYREPTVMLFDEFDSIISYAGEGGDAASQAVNAVAGIFKQEMNGLIEANPNVIVVATTNFPQRVDDSLIRSGRFDIKLSVPLPDEDGRTEIITKMIRRLIAAHETPGFRMFADDVDPRELARASEGMTGADIKEVLRRVQLAKAMQEARDGVVAPPIGQDDLKRYVAEVRSGAEAA